MIQSAQFAAAEGAGERPRSFSWALYRCTVCAGVVAGAWDQNVPQSSAGGNLCVWLIPESQVIDSAIDGKLRAYVEQARDTFHAPSASIMVSGSAVDEVLKRHGYTQGSLYSRIEEAVAKGTITNEMGRWAHQVRLDANDQRHADQQASLPDRSDAERAYDFAKTLVDVLVVIPARVTRGVKNSAPQTQTGSMALQGQQPIVSQKPTSP